MPDGVEHAIGKGISGDGSRIIGDFIDAVSTYFAFVWDRDQGFLDLGLLGDTTGVTSISYDGRIVAWGLGESGRLYDDSLGLIDIRHYLEARGLARQIPDFFGISHISPDGSTLAMAYVEGDDERYVSAIITNFSLPTNCPPDIDLNEKLDTFDFMAFINRFNSGDPRADLDGDGVLTIGDFLAYQAAFDAGC